MAPELAELRALVAAGSPEAAAGLRALADRLYLLADVLERGAPTGKPVDAVGSISDRVRIGVVGPDGKIYQTTDTDPGGPP